MSDLKIPNLNRGSDKFLFKNKLSLRRKSKTKLIKESFVMLFFGIIIIYINYLIPNKISIFNNLLKNCVRLLGNILNAIPYVYEICLAIFIVVSIFFAFVLIIGSFYRLLKITKIGARGVKFK